jgi:hypothetical protein
LFVENEPYHQFNDQGSSHKNLLDQPTISLPHILIFPQERNEDQVEHVEEEQAGEISTTSLGGEDEENKPNKGLTQEPIQEEEITLRRSTRQIWPPIRLRDYVSYKVMYPI